HPSSPPHSTPEDCAHDPRAPILVRHLSLHRRGDLPARKSGPFRSRAILVEERFIAIAPTGTTAPRQHPLPQGHPLAIPRTSGRAANAEPRLSRPWIDG